MIYKVKAKFSDSLLVDFFTKLADGTVENQKPDGIEILNAIKNDEIQEDVVGKSFWIIWH